MGVYACWWTGATSGICMAECISHGIPDTPFAEEINTFAEILPLVAQLK